MYIAYQKLIQSSKTSSFNFNELNIFNCSKENFHKKFKLKHDINDSPSTAWDDISYHFINAKSRKTLKPSLSKIEKLKDQSLDSKDIGPKGWINFNDLAEPSLFKGEDPSKSNIYTWVNTLPDEEHLSIRDKGFVEYYNHTEMDFKHIVNDWVYESIYEIKDENYTDMTEAITDPIELK